MFLMLKMAKFTNIVQNTIFCVFEKLRGIGSFLSFPPGKRQKKSLESDLEPCLDRVARRDFSNLYVNVFSS